MGVAAIKMKIRVMLGFILSKLQPAKTREIKAAFTLPYWGRNVPKGRVTELVESLIRSYLTNNSHQTEDGQELENIHKRFWNDQLDVKWFDKTANEFDSKTLPRLAPILADHASFFANEAITTVCEIGTGDGRLIAHLQSQMPQVQRFVGVDLSSERMAYNSSQYTGIEL